MYILRDFWAAAVHLAGRLDLSGPIIAGLDPARAEDATLIHHGVSPRHVDRLRRAGELASRARPILLTDADYPEQLRRLPHAPPVLFVEGNTERLRAPAVALVGARRCSDLARRFAERLAATMADAGATIVSGLAWGIDQAAHEAAKGRTIGVLGQGLDAHRGGTLRRRADALLSEGGLLVSDLPPGQRPAQWTFPHRNRVISGLAPATVVIEAGERSGSLITARCALDQGRELFVVPDHPLRPHAAGSLALLETGVAPLTHAGPLLELLGLTPAPAPPEAQGLLLQLTDAPDIAALSLRTGEPPRALRQRLTALELSGHVQRLPGGRFAPRVGTPSPRRSPS